MFKRLLFFVYGIAGYAVFLVTFLYAIAFVGGCPLVNLLDGSLPMALAVNCSLLTLFALQHSVMARRWFKERWARIIPETLERSTYVMCATPALMLMFWQWRPIEVER